MKKLDLNRVEKLLNDKEPKGQNNLSSRASFLQRKLYELKALSNEKLVSNKPIDLLYKDLFYGRINKSDEVLQLNTDKLKQIPNLRETVLVIDFVCDAFNDLKNNWTFLANKGILKTDSVYYNLLPKRGWVDSNEFYYNLMGSYYEKFKTFIIANKKNSQIKDFASFIKIFTQFLDVQTPFLPFTKSITNLSRFSTPNISGIVIDLREEKFGNDEKIIKSYFDDANFALFKNTAMRFGFIIDKHAPWRIFADLESPALKPYMEKYKVDNLFSEYYIRSIDSDIDILKPYLMQMYNAYVSDKPFIKEMTFSICNGRPNIRTKISSRKQVTSTDLISVFPDDLWFRFYVYLRGREQNLNWSQNEYEKIVRNCLEFRKGVDNQIAMQYIDNKTKSSMISSKKERDFNF